MILAQLWSTLAWVGGTLLVVIGFINLIYWSKRARWEKCVGTIQKIETVKDVDGTWHIPIINGHHQTKPFEIKGNPGGQAMEIGQEVVVYYDPKTHRHFEYTRLHSAMNIFNPILIGCALLYIAWQAN